MDPKLISGVHVAMDFDVACDVGSLSEVMQMLTELKEYVRGRPNVRNLHIGRMIELNGVFWEDGEPKTVKTVEEEWDHKRRGER